MARRRSSRARRAVSAARPRSPSLQPVLDWCSSRDGRTDWLSSRESSSCATPPCHGGIPLDVRDRTQVVGALGALGADWRDVDVLVNAAGLAAGRAMFQDSDPEDWDRMLDTNVSGVLSVTHTLLPRMIERGTGHVVNIGSLAGRAAYPQGAVYCATKAALDRITTGLRMDLLGTGVRVSTVDPGLVETEFSVVRFGGDQERAADVYRGLTPLTAEDVADAVRWVVERPRNMVVADMLLMPIAQAGSTAVHRTPDVSA
jgi:3-hydroxy acid dehydrogenase / malonic semialdehyde reductase